MASLEAFLARMRPSSATMADTQRRSAEASEILTSGLFAHVVRPFAEGSRPAADLIGCTFRHVVGLLESPSLDTLTARERRIASLDWFSSDERALALRLSHVTGRQYAQALVQYGNIIRAEDSFLGAATPVRPLPPSTELPAAPPAAPTAEPTDEPTAEPTDERPSHFEREVRLMLRVDDFVQQLQAMLEREGIRGTIRLERLPAPFGEAARYGPTAVAAARAHTKKRRVPAVDHRFIIQPLPQQTSSRPFRPPVESF